MSSTVEIREIDSQRGWKDFYKVKCQISRKDPAAVVPIRSMEYELLDDKVHPFYQHAERQAFVAYQSGKPVARIVAIQDFLHNEHYSDRVGFFGFFECPDDQTIANELLKKVKAWLAQRGLDTIRGPVNPSMKSEFGVLVDGNDNPPFVMMGHSPKYYARLLEEAGFSVVRTFYALDLDFDQDGEEERSRLKYMQKFSKRVKRRFPGMRIERATKDNVMELVDEINTLGNEVRSEGWGFVPLTKAELEFMISRVKRIINPKTVVVAYIDDEIAGYIVAIPDLNWAIRKTRGPGWLRYIQLLYWMRKIPRTRAIALGASRKYRRTGVGVVVTKALTEVRDLYAKWELSWVDSENLSSLRIIDRAVPYTKYKKYLLYQASV